MIKSISVVSIMLGMLVSTLIADTTYISGTINTNTVWSPAGSPYIITGNVLVNTGVRLEIQSGVKVLFNYNKYLMIKGKLRAIGTAQDSIIFTALDTTQRWRKLWLKPEAFGCSLKYCKISYACSSAIYNEDTLYIGYSSITNNNAARGGGICNWHGTATITNNIIINNNAYYYGGGIYNYGTATITNNTITNNNANYGGGVYNYTDTATIANNTITNNNADYGGGIYNYGTATITNNIITNNNADYGGGINNDDAGTAIITNSIITTNNADYGGGIYNYGTATITNNTIINNNAVYGGGIRNNYPGTATVTNNTIIDSTSSTIYIMYAGSVTLNYNNLNNIRPTGYTVFNNTADTINARNNYWFTVDTLVIAQKIYDFWNNFNLGEVYYRPFLTAPVPGIEEKDRNEIASLLVRNDFVVFPNPATSYFTVRLPQIPLASPFDKGGLRGILSIKIYDVSGKIVKEIASASPRNDKTVRISLDGIKNGVYFVKVNDEIVKGKLVITK